MRSDVVLYAVVPFDKLFEVLYKLANVTNSAM